ncbi:hypothetical protein, partial [Streptococcus pneumoniae]|uniref:hypothetical protein n=1 Tax=Streptococcus pneumoniae TaxID=1313 RepID=UPI001E2F0383
MNSRTVLGYVSEMIQSDCELGDDADVLSAAVSLLDTVVEKSGSISLLRLIHGDPAEPAKADPQLSLPFSHPSS